MSSWQLWLPAQDEHSSMEEEALKSQAPPLTEELLTADSFWRVYTCICVYAAQIGPYELFFKKEK